MVFKSWRCAGVLSALCLLTGVTRGRSIHPGNRSTGSAHLRHRSARGAPAAEQQHLQRDISRSLVSPRRLDGTLLGDPANIVLSDDQRTAFVMNHHGAVANPEFLQHGGRASIAVMDVRKMLDRRLDGTDSALEHDFDAGWFGGVGLLVTPD